MKLNRSGAKSSGGDFTGPKSKLIWLMQPGKFLHLRNAAAELQIEHASHKLRIQQIDDSRREFDTEINRLGEKSENLASQLEALEGDVSRLAADSEGRLISLQSQQSTVETLQQEVNSAAHQVEDLRLAGDSPADRT